MSLMAVGNEMLSVDKAGAPAKSVAAVVAAAAAMALALSLGMHNLSNPDLGYHILYGMEFWRHGRIVEDDSFVHPRATAQGQAANDLPPGNYYDSQGRFRLVNANWLCQVIMAGLYEAGSWPALCGMRVAIIAMILALQAGILLRLKVPWAWLGPVWLATGLGAYERFLLRPELLGYVCVLAHVWLLCGQITWRRVAAAAAVQVLAANVHSYWLLDIAVVWAFAAEAAGVFLWRRFRASKGGDESGKETRVSCRSATGQVVGASSSPGPWGLPLPQGRRVPKAAAAGDIGRSIHGGGDADGRARLVRLAVCAGLMWPLTMVSPGTWRTAIFPVQVLQFVRENGIAGASADDLAQRWAQQHGMHPWAMIGEFYRPFTETMAHTPATAALIALLAAAPFVLAALMWSRRWALTLIAIAYLAAALSMRRNIASAAMVIWPLAALAGHGAASGVGRWLQRRRFQAGTGQRRMAKGAMPREAAGGTGRPKAEAWLLAAVAAASVLGVWTVATNRFYVGSRLEERFGWGVSRLSLPIGPCQWLDENLSRPQPIFTDYNSSSNVALLCPKATGVPLLTNTWAMPVSRMSEVLAICAAARDESILKTWGMDAVVLQVWQPTNPLAMRLAESKDWALVYAETWYMVFLRRTPENAPIIAANEITRRGFDAQRFEKLCEAADTEPAFALKVGAGTLQTLGWCEQAEKVWRRCLEMRDDFPEAWMNLGVCLATRGDEMRAAGQGGWRACLVEARDDFQRALKLKRGYPAAQQNLQNVQQTLGRQ